MIKDVMAANETVKPKDRKIAVLKDIFRPASKMVTSIWSFSPNI